MPRRTSRDRGRRPPTPRVTPKPPTPTIEERRGRRGRRRRAAPVEEVTQPVTTPVEYGEWQPRPRPYQGTQAGRWLAASEAMEVPMYGRGGIPYSAGLGAQQERWRSFLGQAQQALRPYGFGYGPTWGQPGGFGGGPVEQFTNIYAGQQPAQPWYMREGLGGRAGRASEIMQAWAGGGRPLMVPQSVTSLLGVSEEQMKSMAYERTPGGSWRATSPTRPPLAPPGGGGGGAWRPSYTVYRGAGGRGTAGGMGLVNWRIGL